MARDPMDRVRAVFEVNVLVLGALLIQWIRSLSRSVTWIEPLLSIVIVGTIACARSRRRFRPPDSSAVV